MKEAAHHIISAKAIRQTKNNTCISINTYLPALLNPYCEKKNITAMSKYLVKKKQHYTYFYSGSQAGFVLQWY